MVRDPCIDCAIKHVAQAAVLLMECRKGYPQHWLIAVGHLAEAEDEIPDDAEALLEDIRAFRLQIEDSAGADTSTAILDILKGLYEYRAEKDQQAVAEIVSDGPES